MTYEKIKNKENLSNQFINVNRIQLKRQHRKLILLKIHNI